MGLPVFTPESMKSPEAVADFQSLDLDAACVVAYGQILNAEVLAAPRLGCLNLHGSLLPAGAGPRRSRGPLWPATPRQGSRSCR